VKKNFYLNKILLPIHLIHFSLEIFDPDLVNFCIGGEKYGQESEQRSEELCHAYKALAFKMGSLLNPKLMV